MIADFAVKSLPEAICYEINVRQDGAFAFRYIAYASVGCLLWESDGMAQFLMDANCKYLVMAEKWSEVTTPSKFDILLLKQNIKTAFRHLPQYQVDLSHPYSLEWLLDMLRGLA